MIAEHTPAAPDTILSRAGRLIAGIAYGAIEKAEDNNKVAVVKQAIREIEQAEKEARDALAQARAEEYRLSARRGEIEREMSGLDRQDQDRDRRTARRSRLAPASPGRWISRRSSRCCRRRSTRTARSIDATLTTLRAILSSLQDAEARLAALEAQRSGRRQLGHSGAGAAADTAAAPPRRRAPAAPSRAPPACRHRSRRRPISMSCRNCIATRKSRAGWRA